MTQINLLSWREQAKQAKKIRFGAIAACFAILAIIVIFLLHLYYRGQLNTQLDRNNYLQSQLQNEQGQLTQLIAEKKKLAATNTALNFIVGLQEQSYRAVLLLETLVKSVPDSVTVNKIMREGNVIKIQSKALSNDDVSTFMENLEKTKIFKQPELTLITAKENTTDSSILFEINVELKE